MAERPLYTLYKGLKANNYDVPSSYDSFEKTLVEAGNGGANARHTLFNSLKSQGYDVPDTYESFYRTLFTPINKTTSRAIGGDVPMSEADKRRFSAGAANISAQARQTMQNAGRYNKLKNRQKKQKNDFGRVSIGTHQTPYGGDADNVVKDDFAYNPETGKAGTYVNSDSDDAYNLAEAEQKQAALDQQNQAYQEAVNAGDIPSVFDVRDKTGNYDLQENVGKDGTYVTEEGMQVQYEKKLADAYARKKELEGMIAADNEKNGNPLLSYSASVGAGSGASQDRRMMDVALNQVNAEINSLEAITQTDKNAWYQDMQKAMENTAFTAKTWDFGISDFALMGQLERIKAKMDQKIPLNGMEQTLLKSKVGADAAAALEDEKMGAVYRWTKIAGQSLPFMADFFLTGGYGGITKATSNAALKFAAKKGMGKLGAAILKNTGVVGADIIGSYAMAGTEQAFKTGADIMQRHMGNLYQDENSNYKFGTFDENGNLLHEGGESMGKALYKGMTAAMLENYTEKIFGHNYGLKKGALRFMENHGMARSAEIFKNIGQKEWYAGSKKWMEKFGINGFAEEVMEEEINIPLNALLVGDNKASDLLDPKQQMDIIGGMALSVGSMYALGAGTRPLKGVYNRAQYYRYKNKVDSSDTDAYTAFGSNDAEKWESLRDKIDNAPNEKMGGVLASIITSRDELTKDQIDAAVHYGINLMKMRGYNLAKTEEMNAKEMTGETATPKEQHDEEVETAYSEGHDAEDADKHNIQMEAEDQMTTLAGMLGITEQQLSGMTDEELESLTGQDDKLDQAIYDYQLSTARYQGVVDNANDKVEAAARQASHQTDMLTDKSRGTVRNATVIGINGEEDYGVYIISGKLATHEDGAINIGDSDSMIIYYDPKTQSVKHADARRFVALGDEVPAEEVKAQAIADAKEAAIKAEAGIIDGTVEAGTQFSTTDADGSEHTYEVLADNGDGTAMITIDGNVEQNPYTFEELQTLKDAEDLKRLNAAKAQRGMKEEQRAQQQKEDEQKNAILEQITNADGNVVLVDVIDADGNTRYPGSQVFLVSNDGAKAKVMEMDAEGNLKPHAVNKEDITEISTMSQDEFKQTLPASNIEEDRGEIEVEETEPEPIGKGVFGNVYDQFKGKVKAAFDFLLKHKGGDLLGVFHRDDVGDIDLVWGDKTKNQGIDHIIDKHIEQHNDFASVDEAMSVIDDVINNGAINEKKSKWDKVVIEKDGYSVVIRKNLRDDKGNVVDNSKNWVVTAFESEHKQGEKKVSSDATLAAPSINEGSRAVAPDETSDGKGTNNSAENNENNETLTLEDGTVVPMLEDGNPDFSQLTAEQTAELYDSQFGEDAEQIISGFVSEAKKALDKATNMSVNGKNFAEQKASKADKDKAVADAQTAYDSAKAISDAYAERQLSKETDTHEGRMNLIQKAKNKYARLKNKEEWKNNPFALWNETVGKVLHRLYDGASVDVFDHEPQTVEEYVSSNIAPYSLNFEGKENSKGVAAETGLQRKDFAKSRVLAAEGKGKTVDEFVHKLWEDRPKQLENVSDQEIRNALLSLITSDMNAYDMSHVIEDNRIAQAEEELENNKRAAENAAFEEEQRKAAEEETKKQEEEAKKQAEVAAKSEDEAKAAATAEETGKLDEEMADANDEYEHLAPSYNFENDENLSEEERENMVLRDGDTFAEYRNRNGVDANGTTTPLGIKVARAYIQQKYGDKLADIDAIFGMPMKDHYDGWLMAEQMMKIVDADMNDFDAALLMKNDNVPLSSEAILGYMDGAAELIKAIQDAEKLGLAAFDSAGNPVYKSIIELANWAKEQGLEVDGESVASNYANLYLACKDGFGATTLVPDKGELINMVFYFPGQLIGENGEVNQERLRQMADEFNEGRDALHSAEADIELTDGAQFYNGDTAREFRDFVDKKTEEENKPFGEQIDESELPFSVKEGKGKKQYDRAADVEKNHVSGIEVVDAVVGRKTRKAFDRLAKMMGAKIQWQYSDKMGNGWYDEKVNEDGSVERTIYLTLDSSIMEGAQFIFGHEMTHEMKSKNPTAFDELKNLIINTYGKEAFDKAVDETEKRYKDAGVNYAGGRAAYEEEVVADGIGEMIRDLNLAHTLALKMSHPLLAYLYEILQKIKRAFYGTEYSDKMKEVIRGIEQAYVKTAKGNFEAESGEAREEVDYSLREKEEPKKKGIGYKVFLLGKDGKLYPPMVANPNGAATPVGVWLDADAAPIAGESKTGRPQVKQGGKGTQGGSGKLAYRPGWHLGVIPYALQFNRKDAEGNKTLFPKNFVFAEVEYAADVDYQQEAHDAGINPSGKYQHSLAGLKHLPTDGYYMYRTNPNPETDPWVITGAMKVNRILTRAEQAELVKNAGREPQQIQEGDIVTDDVVNSINQEIADAPKFSLKVYHGSGADFTEFDPHKLEKNREEIAAINKQKKELNDKLNALEEVRRKRMNDILKQYMDEHNLSSEYEVPDDVWMGSRRTANDEYTAKADKVIDQILELNKKLESMSGNGVRYSLKDTDKTLAGVHNITEEKLRKALKLGGFANPSLAVIDTNKSGHNNFGEISFIAPSALLDKRTGKTGGTWITDAYTQRYPSVERQMSEKGSQKFEDWVDSLEYPSAAKAEIKRQTKDVLEDNGVPALELMYLKEKGIDIKAYDSNVDYRWKEIISDHPTAEDILNSMKTDPELNKKVTSLAKYAVIRPTMDKISLAVRRKIYEETGVKKSPISLIVRQQTKEIFERDYAPTLLNKDGSPRKKDVKKVVEDIVKEHNDTKKYDFYLSKVKASNYVNKNGLYDDYIRWQENKLDEFGTKNRIFRGYTKDGSRKYVPETLENVSKAMIEDANGQTNGSEYTTFGSFIAKLASRVDSTDEMRANKDKLSSNKDNVEFYEKWREVYYDLAKFLYNDVLYGEQRLHDIVLQSDPKKYAKKEYGITLTPTFMKKLDALKNAVQTELKSAYFETKYNRPLRLNEFAAAVVPDNLGEDVRKGIENAGLPMYDYDPNKEGDRSRAFNEAINSSDNIRFSLAGERGAAAADKAEERTARIDNLSVARKMEEEKKDAKAIKMATGWERGADGKWRYEMPDAKIKDTMDVGGGQIVKRYEDDMLWNGGKLSDVIDAPELFKAYPQLKDVRVETDAIMNDMPSHGEYDSKTNTITIHADELKYMNDILNHEIQHAIQGIEGFAKGGSPRLVRGEIKKRFDEVTKQIKQLRAEGKEDEAKALIEKNRGLYNAYMKNDDFNSYKSLAGEVEARNVQERMNMTPEERRKSLAESTEDVARKDQIFLGVGDVSFSIRDMTNGKESGAADMAEDLKSLNTPDEVDDAIKTAIDDMPSGWKMANKKMIHIAQALGENRKAEIAGEEPKFSLKDGTLIKAGTYFSGGGLVEEGLKGIIDPVVAVEYDEKISGVYRNNFGQHIVTADVRDVDPRELVKQIDGEVEYFHASPVCKNYSQAKSNHAEVELDKETAASTAEFINAVKPKVVTIENVKGYKDSDAMKTITDALDANGYTWDADVYNAADFGGYTNRERLIVRAVRDGQLPAKPKKMERKSGWYEAVADIIPTLTEKKNGVANWMDVRLKADGIDWRNIDKPLYVMGSAYADGKIPHAFADELLPTLRTKSGDVIVMPDGKVYRAMGRVLARVSGVSDDYKMPFSESLSHTIIGNGIPTQLTEQVIAPLVQNTLRPTPEDGNTKFSLRYDQFEHDLNQWKKDNGLKKDAQRPAIPTRDPGESAVDFMKKVNEYRRQMALWKTAPTYEGHLLTDGTALGEFNRELQRGSVLKRIAFQDSMLAIRKAQEAIMKEHGLDKISMAEDAYTAENRSHGKGKNELEEYNDEFLQPLRKAYKKMKDLMDGSYDNVKVYMMAKHGLERNAQIAFKKALEDDFENVNERVAAYNGYKADVARMQNDADLNNGKIDYVTWRQIDNGIRTKYAPSYPEYRYDKDGNIMDYSGLTALFEGTPDIEVAASDLVQNAEDKYDKEAADLWNAVNAATKKILRDNYKAGMMSEKVYEYVRDMYKNYIPLRGWNETQADQVWDYIGGGKGSFNQTLKEANGRTSIADDPIAYIENMAESGILINNKNWVKQHLMLLAENHPTSLLTLSKAWYVKSTDASGNETWIPASPQITSGMTNQQVEAAMEAFQKKMEKLEETGDATQQRGHMEITYPQTSSEEREHEVRVMKDGEEYVIYVNGDPQLAQAMNNTRAHRVREVQSGKLDRACAWLGRKMAAAYTSLSPLFIPSNYFRDLTMTLASTAIREDGRYNYLLRKNMATSWNMWGLLKGYKDGSLREKVRNGKATEKEQMFYDFMMNGGETGFVSSFDVEDLKKKFKGELKDMDRWAANPKKVLHTIYDSIEFMNRSIENSNRFAIYMTSIQYGRSIEEAVNNAKDVTLNFNRKGTGENGWQMIRNLYLFINPAVQSLQTLGALAKHHPYKFTAVTSAWMVSGALVPLINEGLMLCANLLAGAFGGGDDDDEYKDIKEKYWQFTKWDRRNNLIMWVPFTKEFVKIPLAQEFRGFYAVGDMIASKMLGGDTANESWGEYAEDLIGQVVDMLPLDPTGYDGNIAVSLMPNAVRPMFELAFNVDFTGKPLFKDSEYNKYAPNFTKAYAGTPDWLVRVSRMVNSIGNDYPDVQQNSIDAFGDPRYNLNNPAVVDHVLSSYLGGAYTMGSQVMGVLTKALNDPKEIKMADIPLVSKFVSNPEDRPVAKKQGDEFWTMKENHDRVANTLSKLKKQAKVDGDYSLLEQLYGSEEYKQYKLDDAKVKKYEEDKKKEKAEETGEEYKPHQRTADDVYKEHSSAKDELEDLKMKQIYAKLNGFKSSYDLLLKLAPKQSDDYYQKHKVAIDAVNAVELDKKDISDLKKDFLKDGVVNYDAEKMQKIRGLRKNVLDVLEKANKEVIAEQQKNAQK
nr:MAG TPA: cytosine DNA methyltransferase [Bacteriophage sp.]